ncbi:MULTISPECIES: alpha/beta hydrolase [unclassified Rhodococcus (in: high G+C Gram-positive bacteria)]|uniref:alpha/beta hydrolase n=1 Tax=unclassified Rhodococcus (in: high G+C Gram-positive bacteria) TaxID=192944 RepID=UPI000B9B54B5|nr:MULTISPECIES: alpha/beta hydrolase [unclassified Rhodococcus (in: high G+C Gram-positive bacteria)]OZE34799.1 alpha/beta hydrolase [Rhodococcus sp. 05-2254-4]OZE46157.1 alpha/beta hydrolase [Rhodococcus sp. 05-2254-2]OZE51504.1 alpha/beta hydrolase [Rhodococcus sp. 05-2254-3]
MSADDQAGYTRTDEWFDSEGVRCAAAVYRPTGATADTPAVVMAHGFGTPRAIRLFAYAEIFARAGYTVLVFDYRHFGDSDGQPRQLLDIGKQLVDWTNAVAYARTLDGVDSARIVGWGTSFAGGHVLTRAGAGENFAAVIAQVPHVDGIAAVRATGLRRTMKLAPSAVIDQIRAVRGKSPRYVESVGYPGDVAVMATPDAAPGRDKLLAESGLESGAYPETVAARILLRIGLYSPGRTASKITCPVLVQIMSEDAITPAAVCQKVARRIPDATVHIHKGGHFDPYVQPLFPTIIEEQLAFLKRVVPVSQG